VRLVALEADERQRAHVGRAARAVRLQHREDDLRLARWRRLVAIAVALVLAETLSVKVLRLLDHQ